MCWLEHRGKPQEHYASLTSWKSLQYLTAQGKVIGVTSKCIADSINFFPCNRSLFGGQVIAISGRGFGSNSSQIDIDFGGRSCELIRTTDSEVMCVTTPASRIYQVNNNV